MIRQLILIPTDMERRELATRLRGRLPDDARMELCGFGQIAAAARAAGLVARLGPERVILAGIAGRFGESIGLGEAAIVERVACDGIGVGSAAAFVPAARLGWPQWPGDPADPRSAIGDELACSVPRGHGLLRAPLALSVAAASANPAEAALRRDRFPGAACEEMEGFGVAVACRLADVPLTILRGISNDAGDRDHARWCVQEALVSVADLLLRIVEGAR